MKTKFLYYIVMILVLLAGCASGDNRSAAHPRAQRDGEADGDARSSYVNA